MLTLVHRYKCRSHLAYQFSTQRNAAKATSMQLALQDHRPPEWWQTPLRFYGLHRLSSVD